MKKRNPFLVFVFSFITFGIYYLVWLVKTKNEMNRLGQKIPTAWILIIPIVGAIWWYWVYSKGVEGVTNGKMNGIVTFLLLFLLSYIGAVIVQDSYNSLDTAAAGFSSPDASLPTPPAAPAAFPPTNQAPVAVAPTPPIAPDSTPNQPQTPSGEQPGQPQPPQSPPLVSG